MLLGLISRPRQGLIPTTCPVFGITFSVTRDFMDLLKAESHSDLHARPSSGLDCCEQVFGGNVVAAKK
jgi:hypothetical protein